MPAQDDFQRFVELAKELFGDDEAEPREKFVNTAMERKGYKPVLTWADPEPESGGGDGDSDFFGARRKARETRPVGEKNPPKKAAGGGFFNQY